jgi:hypothetical protein
MTSSTNRNVLDKNPADSWDDEAHHEGMVHEISELPEPRIPPYHMVSTLILRSDAVVRAVPPAASETKKLIKSCL